MDNVSENVRTNELRKKDIQSIKNIVGHLFQSFEFLIKFSFRYSVEVQRSTEENSYKFPRVNPFPINWDLKSQ